MTLKRAIKIASACSKGHVCTLRDGDAEEYHKMALAAFRAMQEATLQRQHKAEKEETKNDV